MDPVGTVRSRWASASVRRLRPEGLFAAGVWEGREYCADAGMGFEQAFGDEVGDDLVGGVGVDLEFFAEGADGGEGVSGAELAGDHGLLGGVDDLLEEGDAYAEWDAE